MCCSPHSTTYNENMLKKQFYLSASHVSLVSLVNYFEEALNQ